MVGRIHGPLRRHTIPNTINRPQPAHERTQAHVFMRHRFTSALIMRTPNPGGRLSAVVRCGLAKGITASPEPYTECIASHAHPPLRTPDEGRIGVLRAAFDPCDQAFGFQLGEDRVFTSVAVAVNKLAGECFVEDILRHAGREVTMLHGPYGALPVELSESECRTDGILVHLLLGRVLRLGTLAIHARVGLGALARLWHRAESQRPAVNV